MDIFSCLRNLIGRYRSDAAGHLHHL